MRLPFGAKLLSPGDVDLVVSELILPQSDGLALLAEARKQPWGKDVAVIRRATAGEGRGAARVRARRERLRAEGLVDRRVRREAPRDAHEGDEVVEHRRERLLARDGVAQLVNVLWQGRKTGKLKNPRGPSKRARSTSPKATS